MRSAAPRSSSRTGTQSLQNQVQSQVRRVFNCIVDDTALVAGVKKSTRTGIRQWVSQGWVRIFVPLYALEQLSRSRNGTSRHSQDVRDVMQWLDEATTNFPHAVTLQGGFDTFERWEEVDRFKLPKTLFSETDQGDADDDDDMHGESDPKAAHNARTPSHMDDEGAAALPAWTEHTTWDGPNEGVTASSTPSDASLALSPSPLWSPRSSTSQISPPTSPTNLAPSPAKPAKNMLNGASGHTTHYADSDLPFKLRPLINYILWRIHQETDPAAALKSFIFLCNDPSKARVASAFGVRAKRLEELRNAILKEERDLRERPRPLTQSSLTVNPQPVEVAPSTEEEDDEEVLFKPKAMTVPLAPAAMRISALPASFQGALIDPHAFGRSSAAMTSRPQLRAQPTVNVAPRSLSQFHIQPNTTRGSHVQQRFAPRGKTFRGSTRERGNVAPNGGSFPPARDVSVTSRGGRSSFVAKYPSGSSVRPASSDVLPNGQIDPDSFERPRGGRGGFNGRGGGKLWVPTPT